MNLYVAKVTWYTEGEEGPIVDYLCIAGDGINNVASQLCRYYHEDEIDSIEIKLINPEHPFVRLPDEQTYEAIKERGEI